MLKGSSKNESHEKLDRPVQTRSGLKAGNSEPGCFDQVGSLCIANQGSQVTVTEKSPETGVTTLDSERNVVVCVFRSACAWLSSVTLQRPPGSVSVITSRAMSRSVNLRFNVLKSRRRPHRFSYLIHHRRVTFLSTWADFTVLRSLLLPKAGQDAAPEDQRDRMICGFWAHS